MNRPLTILLAVLDAVVVVVIGLGIPLVILTLLWAVQFDFALDWAVFWRAAVDVWLLGNGVDLQVILDPQLLSALPFDASAPFEISIAPLGWAMLNILFGRRSGIRLAETSYRILGVAVGLGTVLVLSLLLFFSAQSQQVLPSLLQTVIYLPGIYGLGLLIGLAERRVFLWQLLPNFCADRWKRIPTDIRAAVALACRGGAMMAGIVIAISAFLLALTLVFNYSQIVSFYEVLQTELAGGVALTGVQLALVPNLVLWVSSWLIGPGFALGEGTSVSPVGTQLGLIPPLPVFGALPQGIFFGAFLGVLVPVIVGFIAAALLRARSGFFHTLLAKKPVAIFALGAGMGIVGAAILSLCALWSGGALGPGRLAEVGPNPGQVFLWAAGEFGLSAVIALFSGAFIRRSRSFRARAAASSENNASSNQGFQP